MDPEERKLLERTLRLVEENNSMIHKMRRAQKWASFTRTLYWIVIIGVSIGAFYFLQPYINKMQSLMQYANIGVKK